MMKKTAVRVLVIVAPECATPWPEGLPLPRRGDLLAWPEQTIKRAHYPMRAYVVTGVAFHPAGITDDDVTPSIYIYAKQESVEREGVQQ